MLPHNVGTVYQTTRYQRDRFLNRRASTVLMESIAFCVKVRSGRFLHSAFVTPEDTWKNQPKGINLIT
jgi:hypothetical protein